MYLRFVFKGNNIESRSDNALCCKMLKIQVSNCSMLISKQIYGKAIIGGKTRFYLIVRRTLQRYLKLPEYEGESIEIVRKLTAEEGFAVSSQRKTN